MISIAKYILGVLLATILSLTTEVMAKEKLKFIETIGRAVIEKDQKIDIARRRALEDALYLASLHGGAKISGFSAVNTDTSLEENLVVQPSSRIIDYTILAEEKDETHYKIRLRSAVGDLKIKKCGGNGAKTISVFQPIIEIDPKAPFWTDELTVRIIREMLDEYSSEESIELNNNIETVLDPSILNTVNDSFDYISLTSGRIRTEHGDYSIVPSIKIREETTHLAFTKRQYLKLEIQTNVLSGDRYREDFSKTKNIELMFGSGGPWRTLNILLSPNNDQIVEPLFKELREHVKSVLSELKCKPVQSKIALVDGKLEVPLGKKHGINFSSLAVIKGERTAFSILRVEGLLNKKTILVPLNNLLELEKLSGETVQFIENL
jgi:hypothetical protein